jgi:hypothetical protein
MKFIFIFISHFFIFCGCPADASIRPMFRPSAQAAGVLEIASDCSARSPTVSASRSWKIAPASAALLMMLSCSPSMVIEETAVSGQWPPPPIATRAGRRSDRPSREWARAGSGLKRYAARPHHDHAVDGVEPLAFFDQVQAVVGQVCSMKRASSQSLDGRSAMPRRRRTLSSNRPPADESHDLADRQECAAQRAQWSRDNIARAPATSVIWTSHAAVASNSSVATKPADVRPMIRPSSS